MIKPYVEVCDEQDLIEVFLKIERYEVFKNLRIN